MLEIEISPELTDILSVEIEVVAKKTPIVPFLVGEAGIGKSSLVEALCEIKNWMYFELLCNQLGDRTDITGCRTVKTETEINGHIEEIWQQVFFPHQSIQDAITAARNNPDKIIVLFLDEINRAGSDITSAIMSFTTSRKVGTFRFPDNIRFIVAGNDTGNIVALDSASISRFAKYKIRPSAQTYMSIEKNLNPYIKQVLTSNPQLILCKDTCIQDMDSGQEEEYQSFNETEQAFLQLTVPRTLSGLNAFLNACKPKKLSYYMQQIIKDTATNEDASLLQMIIEAHIGHTQFAQELCKLIAQDVTHGLLQNANQVDAPEMPDIYNDILRCADRQTRNNMFAQMSDDDISAVITYAVYDSRNNADLITDLARHFNGNLLTPAYMPNFSTLKAKDALNPDNYMALINSGTELGKMMQCTLGN